MKWFIVSDMHSGGYRKTQYEKAYIQAETEEAAGEIFKQKTGANVYGCACECCGSDFWIYEVEQPEPASEIPDRRVLVVPATKEEDSL